MQGPLDQRRAGVLLHPTSLPGPGYSGVLGAEAFRFVDFLVEAGFSMWQTLPLGPVDRSGSPYQMKSVHAGNPALIDPGGFATADRGASGEHSAAGPAWIPEAYQQFRAEAADEHRNALDAFVQDNRAWLLPYSLFEHYRRRFEGAPWWDWPEPIRSRDPRQTTETLAAARDELRVIAFEQYLFSQQWSQLRDYAHQRGVRLFGDLPFYVDTDSVEVWWHRRLFRIDDANRPEAVAGVPPDYFNSEGQLWGNPLYRWDAMRADGFRWWASRIRHELQRFDILRIDHFRALESFWEIPAGAASAREGHWAPAPGAELLGALQAELGALPLVAEDLGTITPEVRALRDRFGLPGMLVLQFAFDGSPDNPYLPANHSQNAVVYTGTHDNDTTLGWYRNLDAYTRSMVDARLASAPNDMPGALIRATFASPAQLAILPMQDLLGLGSDSRMNTPGTPGGNWRWRFQWDDLWPGLAARCRGLAVQSTRVPEINIQHLIPGNAE
jgi:4-alpha-glucanotransferase